MAEGDTRERMFFEAFGNLPFKTAWRIKPLESLSPFLFFFFLETNWANEAGLGTSELCFTNRI